VKYLRHASEVAPVPSIEVGSHGLHGAIPHNWIILDRMSDNDSAEELKQAIGRYNDAWNAHSLDAIMAMHAPDMVFDNHTAG